MTARRLLSLVVLGAFALAACADEPPSPGDGGTPTPLPAVGADEVVLRLSYEGGLVPAGFPLLDVPAFTLFGDGTVVTPGAQIEIYPGPALPAIATRQVDEAAVRAIVERAQAAGLDGGDIELDDTGDVAIADASTAVFVLTVDGRTTTATAYALGFEGDAALPGVSDEERRVRGDLASLASDLTDLSWVHDEGGTIGPEEAYEGDAARLLVGPVQDDPELPQDTVAWPIEAPLRSLGEPVSWDDRTRCAIVEGDDWLAIRAAAEHANQLSPWTDGRTRRSIAFRPLLPDEAGC